MTRDLIRHTLSECLLPCTAVLAMWEAGSAAFGRADAYSDLDIGLLVRDGSNEEVWAAVDRAFEQLEGLSLRWLEPSPLFTGLDKRVFRLRMAGPWLQVDIGVFAETASELHNQPQRHGQIAVVFDHHGRLTPPSWDVETRRRQMCHALHQEIMKWQVYHAWFRKELARGRSLDAFASYFGATVRPLVAVLGMRYRPSRWDFGLRYLKEDMPPDVVRTIERLCYVSDETLLAERFQEADRLFVATVRELEEEGIIPVDNEGLDICPPLQTLEDS